MKTRKVLNLVSWVWSCMILCSSLDVNSKFCKWSIKSCEKRWKELGNTTLEEMKNESPIDFDNFYYRSNCFCDRQCTIFNDCCADYEQSDIEITPIVEIMYPDYKPSCEAYVISKKKYHFSVITKCSPLYRSESDIKTFCEQESENDGDLMKRIPVLDKKSSVMYKNIFCGLCNSFDENGIENDNSQDLIFLKTQAKCREDIEHYNDIGETNTDSTYGNTGCQESSNKTIREIFNECQCELEFHFPENVKIPRFCKAMVKECPTTWQDEKIKDQCIGKSGNESETVFVYDAVKGTIYRNKYCALCHNVPLYDLECLDPNAEMKDGLLGGAPPPYVPFSVLFDFNTGQGNVEVGFDSDNQYQTIQKQCEQGFVYDIFKSRCRELFCPPGMSLQEGHCIPVQRYFADYVSNEGKSCPLIKLNMSDYTVDENKTLFVQDMTQSYDKNEYVVQDGAVFICATNFSQNYTVDNGNSRALKFGEEQSILSLCGQIISLISLAIHFSVYLCLKPLRNLPGLCLMNLVASLFVAQLSFLVSSFVTAVPWLCKTIAVVSHYGFLTTFAWMNVLAYDLWNTFHAEFLDMSKHHGSKRYYLYAACAYTIPLALCTISLILDATAKHTVFSPSYGTYLCWINNKYGLMLLFATPIGISLLVNFFFFAFTVYHICKASRSNVALKGDNSRNKVTFFLYLKLAVLMGLTWIFGFIAGILDVEFFWYLFIILNTLQGLFICLAFLCNKKVGKLCKEKSKEYDSTLKKHSISTSTFLSKKTTATTSL